MKLRKHLRTKKLDKIEQLGIDRVIDLTFGKGEAAYHILVELYASGNVILTDHEYTILSLLRSHKFEDETSISVKAKYPFSHAANLTIDHITVEPEKIRSLMEQQQVEPEVEQNKKKQKKEEKLTLKVVLTKMVPYASFPYADHVIRLLDADPNAKADPRSDSQISILIEAAKKLRELVANMENLDEIKGFIIYKPEAIKADLADEDKKLANPFEFEIVKKFEGKIVQDFVPVFLLKQHETENHLEYASFD